MPEHLRGTYAGLATPAVLESIRKLGVTTVELMPVHQFMHEPGLLDEGLRNYWGYHTYGFFAPHAEYAAADDRGGQVREFKEMVKAFHAAGLEVILDVVYNHTSEGNHLGPHLNFKGFDNPAYYHLVAEEPRYYMDYTGTGNSVNLRHPYVLQLVMDSLRYWVQEMHVDGFRFDLAATLARGAHTLDTWSAFFATIHQDPVLQGVKLIAEPWDTGTNGYQVGNFPFHWSEWNDRYRESVRGFWRNEPGRLPEVAARLTGSIDLFKGSGRRPSASINYIASHDGHTLRRNGTRSGSGSRRGSAPVRETLRRDGSAGRRRRSTRRSRGGTCWARPSARPSPAPARARTTAYGRPARRSTALPGILLPSLRRRPPRVAVVIDTSGSVSDAELGSALLEVAAIARAVGGQRDLVTVLPCDAAARVVHPLCRAEGIPLVGGGGTDLRTGFTRALRTRPQPDVIVALTDGQTPWPDARPPCRTVVGLFPRPGRARSWNENNPDYVPDSPPGWARVVVIGDAPAAR